MSDAQKAIEYAHQNRERFSRELTEFIRIESFQLTMNTSRRY